MTILAAPDCPESWITGGNYRQTVKIRSGRFATINTRELASRVTWGMTAPGGKTVPHPVDNLKLPRTSTVYTECCYHLPDTCFERSTPRSRRTLKYSIFNIYTFFDVIFPNHYTCHSSLYISDNKEILYHANT